MLKVFITVDTEIWPQTHDWSELAFDREVQRDIWGATEGGEFGIGFQMDVLETHGLRGVFFVEALFACAVGLEPLRKIVEPIQRRGHEVQLHLHTEWLHKMPESILPGRLGQNMKDFTEDEQSELIAKGIENLKACGVENVSAFRAGNFGANLDTLQALARNGVDYDSSYNICYQHLDCDIRIDEPLLQPQRIDGIYELPVSFFEDRPGHYRHVQLAACSSGEIANALIKAWKLGWDSLVIVSHSFELLRKPPGGNRQAAPDRMVIRRFKKLCRFLGENKDKFQTATFADLNPEAIPLVEGSQPLKSNILRTAWRVSEQILRRWY